jgi:ATP-binding cassette ChvD family protein
MSSTSQSLGPKEPVLRGSSGIDAQPNGGPSTTRPPTALADLGISVAGVTARFIYTMRDLRRFYPPDREVLKGISISMFPGAKIGVLGTNGSGKSSVLRIMAGEDDGYTGEARLTPGFTVGHLAQEPQLDPSLDVTGNVALGMGDIKAVLDRYNKVCELMGDPSADFDKLLAEQAELQERIDAANAWDLDRTLDIAMDALRLPPGDSTVATLSGGERRRVALCRLLLEQPDLLLLDEPTNHLDAESVAWLERTLRDYPGTVVAVTHDRYFLDNVAGWILELDRGAGIPWEGNYSSWLEQKQARLAGEERADIRRQRTLERELEWIHMSPRARQAKGKARLNSYEAMLAEAETGPERLEKLEISIPPGPRLGDIVVQAERLAKGFGERLLMDGLTFDLPPNGIVGVIGPNGAGKTTLFRMITGDEQPDAGELRVGSTVKLGYVDQSRDSLNPDHTVYEEITGGQKHLVVGNRELHGRAYVAGFNFKGSDQQKSVRELSGGERNRVHLAKVLTSGANVLLLDEPTNDLDVDTLRALEDALLEFAGCAVVISHDRWFLDRVATHVLAFEGESEAVWYQGNFTDYEADRRKRLGAAADQPHRIRYKPLVRD